MNGYIKLHRQIENWEWYKDIPTKVLFFHLLIKANHKDNKWHGIQICRGQVLTSTQKLSEETGLTIQQTRTALKKLKKTGELTCTATSKYTLINIENYGFYQGKDEHVNKQPNKQVTSKQQASNKQVTTNKKEKNNKNDKKDKNTYMVEQVIDYLNSKTGKNYSARTEASAKLIRGRLSEGYSLEDFFTVIDKKCDEWEGTEQEKYLRPQTLFSPGHFEDYVNQKAVKKTTGNPFLDMMGELL